MKVQAKVTRKSGKEYRNLYLTIPSAYARLLGISEGDVMEVTVIETEIADKRIKGLFYYKIG